MSLSSREIVMFEQPPLASSRDMDAPTLARLLRTLSALSDDVVSLAAESSGSEDLTRHVVYLDRNIKALAQAAASVPS